MRSMVEGHVRCIVSFIRNAAPPVPLHHLRWSPSPFQGGSAAIGRYRPFPSRNLRPQAAATCPPLALKGIERTTHHPSASANSARNGTGFPPTPPPGPTTAPLPPNPQIRTAHWRQRARQNRNISQDS